MTALSISSALDTVQQAVECYNIGVAYVREGNIEGAVDAFQAVLRLEPDSAPALNGLGICYHFMGNQQEAVRAYEHAAKLDARFAAQHQRTLMDRLATLYRHKFLHPGMETVNLIVADDDDD